MKWLVCIAVAWSGAACVTRCVPGESESCACANGWRGAALCRANGTFAACSCDAPPAPPDAGPSSDAGGPDLDAGPVCNLNRSRPRLPPPLSAVLRVPVGGALDFSGVVESSNEPGVWSLSYSLRAGSSVTPLQGDGRSARLEGVAPGLYTVAVEVESLCGGDHQAYPIEVVALRRLPFELSHGVCCDANQRPFVSARNPPRVLRLELDGGATELLEVSRTISSLTLSADRSSLLVAQDAVLEGYDTTSFTSRFSWPVPLQAPLVWLSAGWAWALDREVSVAPSRIDLSTGEIRTMIATAQSTANAVLNVDERTAALCASGDLMSATVIADGGIMLRGAFNSCCDGVFATPMARTVLTGCGTLSEITDAGLLTAGALEDGVPVALAVPGDGMNEWVVARGLPSPSLFTMNTFSFTTTEFSAGAPVGVANRSLSGSVAPNFMYVDQLGVAHVFTAVQQPADTTWEETFP